MKKLFYLFIAILSVATLNAQDTLHTVSDSLVTITLPTNFNFSSPQQMYYAIMTLTGSIVTIITGYLTIHFKFLQGINSKVWRIAVLAVPLIAIVIKFGFNPDVTSIIWTTLSSIITGTFVYDKVLKPYGLKSTEKQDVSAE